MRVQVSPFVTRGQWLVAADTDHPEVGLGFSEDLGELDGSVIICHPDDEEWVRALDAR